MNFTEHQQHTLDLIQSNQLDQITRFICPYPSPLAQRSSDDWLIQTLLTIEPKGSSITEKTETIWNTLTRLLPLTFCGSGSYHYLLTNYGPHGILAWIERGWIDLKNPWFLPILLCDSGDLTVEATCRLVDHLLEVGLNINDETSLGDTLLCHYLRECSWSYRHPIRQMLPYLLEKGADPLLEGRRGRNAFDVLYECFPMEKNSKLHRWLLAELGKWA